MAILDIPSSSQSNLPSRSYERTLPDPAATNSVRFSFSHTNGVDQLLFSSRFTFHNSSPVFAFRQSKYESFSLSLTMNRRSLCNAGEAAGPQLNLMGMASNFFDHFKEPSRS